MSSMAATTPPKRSASKPSPRIYRVISNSPGVFWIIPPGCSDCRSRFSPMLRQPGIFSGPDLILQIPLCGRSAVGIAGFFDGHAADVDAGEIGGAETGLFGKEDMIVAEIEGLGPFGDTRIFIAHD